MPKTCSFGDFAATAKEESKKPQEQEAKAGS